MANEILVFDRSPVTRLFSCAAVFASAALVFNYIAQSAGDIDVLSLGFFLLIFLGTVAAAIFQYGDHIYFSDNGVMYENKVFSLFGRRGRWMRWEDIIEIRELRKNVLVLLSRDGQRMLIDAILGYAIARNEVLKRAPQAILSGELAAGNR